MHAAHQEISHKPHSIWRRHENKEEYMEGGRNVMRHVRRIDNENHHEMTVVMA